MNEDKMKPGRIRAIVLTLFGFSGAAALIYEVAWVRALSNVMGGSTYAVSTMLAAFMGGLALGGYLGGAAGSRSKNPILLFGAMEAGTGVFGLLTIPAINSVSPLYFMIFNKYHLSPDIFYASQFAICFLVMAVPTTLMGACFPVVTRIVSQEGENISAGAGRAYSINTLGALAGSFIAGFVLIPALGLKGTVQLAAGVNIAIALIAVLGSNSLRKVFYCGAGIVFVVLANIAAVKSEPRAFQYNYYIANRYKDFVKFNDDAAHYKTLFRRDDPQGSVQVYYSESENLLQLQSGGRIEGATNGGDMENMVFSSHFPIVANPDAKSFLGIGLGSGLSLRAAAYRVDEVTWVEINPSVVAAVQKYFYPGMMDSGADVVVDDARNYLQATNKKFDIISSYPSFPADQGSGRLFTREFFKIAASRLNRGGVMCQWFPYYLYSDEAVKVFVKTFQDSFPVVSAWRMDVSGDLFLLGSKEPLEPSFKDMINNIYKIKDFPFLLRFKPWRAPELLPDLIKHSEYLPYNTDDKPVLEFLGARAFIVPIERIPNQDPKIF